MKNSRNQFRDTQRVPFMFNKPRKVNVIIFWSQQKNQPAAIQKNSSLDRNIKKTGTSKVGAISKAEKEQLKYAKDVFMKNSCFRTPSPHY